MVPPDTTLDTAPASSDDATAFTAAHSGAATWAVVRAADLAGVTRALARSCVTAGLVPARLSVSDLVCLRAMAILKPMLFPGETAPANQGRSDPKDRDWQAVRAIAQLGQDPALTPATTVLVFADRVLSAHDVGGVVNLLLQQHNSGEVHLALPVGAWFGELADLTQSAKGADVQT